MEKKLFTGTILMSVVFDSSDNCCSITFPFLPRECALPIASYSKP